MNVFNAASNDRQLPRKIKHTSTTITWEDFNDIISAILYLLLLYYENFLNRFYYDIMDSFHEWTLLEDDAVAEDNVVLLEEDAAAEDDVVLPLTVLEEFPELDRLLERA